MALGLVRIVHGASETRLAGLGLHFGKFGSLRGELWLQIFQLSPKPIGFIARILVGLGERSSIDQIAHGEHRLTEGHHLVNVNAPDVSRWREFFIDFRESRL